MTRRRGGDHRTDALTFTIDLDTINTIDSNNSTINTIDSNNNSKEGQ
jgi:hypothetical protein